MNNADQPAFPVKLPISGGKGYSLIDSIDLGRASQYSWCFTGSGVKVRARARISGGRQYLHRFIAVAPKHLEVDHINGNGLDNRRCNLRLCTRSQNAKNRNKNRNSSSRFKGVRWHDLTSKWMAAIKCDGKEFYLGLFDNDIDAALVYDSKARELHGQFAKTNF